MPCGGIRLRSGHTYTLAAELAADRPAIVRLTVQMQYAPFKNVLTRDVMVEPQPCRFSYTAGSDVDTLEGVVGFHLGGDDTDYTLLLDNVSLIEHTP